MLEMADGLSQGNICLPLSLRTKKVAESPIFGMPHYYFFLLHGKVLRLPAGSPAAGGQAGNRNVSAQVWERFRIRENIY
jgi:hypothetical protein